MSSSSALFQPLKVGDITLQHRLVMAPMTRLRANEAGVLGDEAVTYYSQRSATPGTLIISEGTYVSPESGGFPNGPAIYSPEQVAAFKKVVDVVHAQNSFFFIQLFGFGRGALPSVLENAPGGPFPVVGPSAIPLTGRPIPHPLTREEIQGFIQSGVKAALNSISGAGADGVEVHVGNGYLLHQFIDTNANQRTDEYGGSVENRARLPLEVVDAFVAAVGAEKVGVRVTPYNDYQEVKMDLANTIETYSYFFSEIKRRHPNLAYFAALESRTVQNEDVEAPKDETLDFLYDLVTPTPFFYGGGFTPELANETAETKPNSAIQVGRPWTSNPDLVERFKQRLSLTNYDRSTFYTPGPVGYIDWPTAQLSEVLVEA
ncbi:FMN-linked oxidoreductase [Leucosporidium creatinivorum]|uniref:FMN-linked oxidoreductase n=1 Tax=Leucosporidium creatinivorum TaxID=106004 RepID=A0A1Y2G037_9BASI|nr:FMN-linked oxidoreductase [Leucosporidium creatinivorum]